MRAEKSNLKIGKVKKVLLIIKNVIVYGLAIIGLVSIIWFLAYRSGKKIGFMQKENETTVQTTQSTDLGLKDMGELVTQSAYVTVICDNQSNSKLFNKLKVPFSDKRQLFSYVVKVDASVDFTKITEEIKENKIIINLPHADVFETSLNNDSLKVYLQEGNMKLEETNDAQKALKEQAETDAISNGLLEQADTNAKNLIERFVKSNEEFKDFEVVFEYIEEVENIEEQTENK